MNGDQILQWKADYDHVAARTRQAAIARLDEVMARLGYGPVPAAETDSGTGGS